MSEGTVEFDMQCIEFEGEDYVLKTDVEVFMRDVQETVRRDFTSNIKITYLKEQIEILEKSNEFYADESNYMMCRDIDEAILHDQQPLRDTIDMDDCDPNGGKLARQTKQQLKELREGSEK